MVTEDFLRRHIRLILEKDKDKKGRDSREKSKPPTSEKPKDSKNAGSVDAGSDPEEGEKTERIGGGRYSKKLSQTKSLADSNPKDLMKKLSISSISGDDTFEATVGMYGTSISSTPEMSDVYALPHKVEDNFGRKGALIGVKGDAPIRDAALFLRLTARGARNAGILGFEEKVFVEKYQGGLLMYLGERPYTWNTRPTSS